MLISTLCKTPVTAPGDQEIIIKAPSFDHAKQDPIADDTAISSRNKIVIIEGNYTLLNEEPWDAISRIVHDRSVQFRQAYYHDDSLAHLLKAGLLTYPLKLQNRGLWSDTWRPELSSQEPRQLAVWRITISRMENISDPD